MPHSFQVSAKGIAVDGDKVLILLGKQKGGADPFAWDLPGGRLERGESLQEGLAREISEELPGNSVATIHELVDAKVDWHRFIKQDVVVLCWRIQLASTSITLSHEHQEYRWVNKEEFDNLRHHTSYDMLPDQARAVAKVLHQL